MRRRFFVPLGALGVALGCALVPWTHAHAGSTRTFNLDTLEDLSGGTLRGVAVGSDGVVRAGWTLGETPMPDASSAFCSLLTSSGALLVGTGPNGKVFRVAGDRAEVFADTGELAVTSLVEGPGGTVYAATIPGGKILKLTQGKSSVLATLPGTEHVWALSWDKGRTHLFAATGPDGKLFRVGLDGSASVHFDSEEPHLVSLAVDDASGDVWVGSSGNALLYRVTGPGRTSFVYDFPGDEVKAIAPLKGGGLFAIANEYPEPPEPPRRSPNAGRIPAGPSAAPRPKPGKGTLFRFDAAGRPEKMMNNGDTHFTALTVNDKGEPFVGTGVEGRVYTVSDSHAVTLVADTEERQVGAFAMAPTGGDGNPAYVVSSDPVVVHRVLAKGGPESVWTSKVLDATLRARFGKLRYRGTGNVEVSVRTGNTATPDETWLPWSSPLGADGTVSSPLARFLQVRARWASDPKATLSEVVVPYVPENVRPIVLEVTTSPKNHRREGGTSEPPKHQTTVKIAWKVDNGDNDPLRYRLAFRRQDQATFRPITHESEVLTKTEYEWDTVALSEGQYRLRVEASDELANPPDQALRHALESAVFPIDNTPPSIVSLEVKGRHLKARATDTLGPLVRAEFAVDGSTDFFPLAAADGVFDEASENLDADLSAVLPAGPHLVTVRVYDQAGNVVSREVEATPAR